MSGSPGGRWTTVGAVVVALFVIAQLSLVESDRDAPLGLRAVRQDAQVMIVWVQPVGVAWDAGIRPGDVVVGIAGRPVSSDDTPAEVAEAPSVDVRAINGGLLHATAGPSPEVKLGLQRFSFLALACAFVAVGATVFVVAVDVAAASVVLANGVAAAMALLGAIAVPSRTSWSLAFELISIIAFFVTVFLLFLVFPVNRLDTRPGRWAAIGCIALHAPLLAAYAWIVVLDPSAYSLLRSALIIIFALDLAGAIYLAVAAFVTNSSRTGVRDALALVILGIVAGLGPFVLLALVPDLFGSQPIMRPDIAILTLVLLPLSLGMAVVRREYFGITHFVRRGLVALIVWTALLATYSAGLGFLQRGASGSDPLLAAVVDSNALLIAVIAVSFPLVQRTFRNRLERLMFRDVYDYRKTLQQLSREIAHLTSAGVIMEHILNRVGRTLDLVWAVIALRPGGEGSCWERLVTWPDDFDPAGKVDFSLGTELTLLPITRRGSTRVAPLVVDGVPIGVLALGPKRNDVEFLREDEALVATLAPLLATAIQNGLLVSRLESQVAALDERERMLAALNGRLLDAQEEERRRIALDLHDDPLQRAFLLARQLGDAGEEPAAQRWRQNAEEIVWSLRAICAGLRPPVLDDFGLIPGLEWLSSEIQARSDLAVTLRFEPAERPSFERLQPELEIALFRVAQEALNNCWKHANATNVEVCFRQDDGTVELTVADDGCGIADRLAEDGQSLQLGIAGMRERLRGWGGSVDVRANQGGGTVVTARVPKAVKHE